MTIDTVTLDVADALTWLKQQPDESVDLVFGSPPYALKAGRYPGLPGTSPNDPAAWACWMHEITVEACRVSRGYVFWVVDSPWDRDSRDYAPAVETLLAISFATNRVRRRRPHVWHKNGPPGPVTWPGHDYELIPCFVAPGRSPYYDPDAVATPVKHRRGGKGRQRRTDGTRPQVSGSWESKTGLARPKDVVRVTVGGGHMGLTPDDDRLATSGEAPFPVKLPMHFVAAFSPPGGRVCDPFVGTGTTAVAATVLGRRFVGCDLRESQVALTRRRLAMLDKFAGLPGVEVPADLPTAQPPSDG